MPVVDTLTLTNNIIISVDGATKGSNPAIKGGLGLALWFGGELDYASHHHIIGDCSNNLVEMAAVQNALFFAARFTLGQFVLLSDSEFCIRTLNDENKLKDKRILKMVENIRQLEDRLIFPPQYTHRLRSHPYCSFTDFLSKLGCHNNGAYTTPEGLTAIKTAYNRDKEFNS